jgi:SAM-dependent methyltransferase
MAQGEGLNERLRWKVQLIRERISPPPRTGIFPEQERLPMPPPKLLRQAGPIKAFHEIPLMFLARMNMAGLRPDHRVLDIGCGIGRIARYLCGYIGESGSYEGFDVLSECIEWCRENITPAYPNFRFTATPLRNTYYTPDPELPDAASFRFPYDDDSFDFVCANSVFTHLMPDVSQQYLKETARVLRPGGVSCTTWFWYNDEGYSHELTERMQRQSSGSYAVLNPDNEDAAVGYPEAVVREMCKTAGLSVVEPLHPGYRLQDCCVAEKALSS